MVYCSKNLAGTNGISAHDECVYIEVVFAKDRFESQAARSTSIT